MNLTNFKHWIFDMDGTLTVAIHDFDAIRNDLGIPQGKRILEAIGEMPSEKAKFLYKRLDEIEMKLTSQTKPQKGALELLSLLKKNNANLGILTRNNKKNAQKTLNNCCFSDFFKPEYILGRESVEPKPNPDGIYQLLKLWNADPKDTVMVGDHQMDVEAGSLAGTFTIFLNKHGNSAKFEHSGLTISNLNELLVFLNPKLIKDRYKSKRH